MKHFIIYGFDTGFSALFGIAVLIVASQSLAEDLFGSLVLVVALVTLQMQVSTMGIDKVVYARFSNNTRKSLVSLSRCFPSVILSGFSFYSAGFVALLLMADTVFLSFYCLAGLRLLFSYSEVFRAGFRARGMPQRFVPARCVSVTLAFIFLALWKTFNLSPHLIALVWASDWVIFSLILSFLNPTFLSTYFWARHSGLLLRKGFPSLVQMAAVAFYYRFDQLYIGAVFPSRELAIYAIGARLGEAGNVLFGVLGFVLGPIFVSHLGSSDKQTALFPYVLVFFGVAAGFLTVCWAFGDSIVLVLFGPTYIAAADIFRVYAVSAPFTVLGFVGSALAIARGAYWAPMVSGLLAVTVCVVSTVLLTRAMGPIGAAYATVFSYAVAAGWVWFAALRSFTKRAEM